MKKKLYFAITCILVIYAVIGEIIVYKIVENKYANETKKELESIDMRDVKEILYNEKFDTSTVIYNDGHAVAWVPHSYDSAEKAVSFNDRIVCSIIVTKMIFFICFFKELIGENKKYIIEDFVIFFLFSTAYFTVFRGFGLIM